MTTYHVFTDKKCRYAFENYTSFAAWKSAAKPALEKLLGLDELYKLKRNPIIPKTIWKRENHFSTIEKVTFETEPGVQTFAYLCFPKNVAAPYKTFIVLQGHSTGMHCSIGYDYDEIKQEGAPAEYNDPDLDYANSCLKAGYAAICLEQRYFGNNSPNKDHRPDCYIPTANNFLVGRTTIGERVYDVDRVIDYLHSRNDIDRSHIGVMGLSGGGTATMFSGAMLERITHFMPAGSFSSFRASIMSMNHCLCNFVPGLLLYGEAADCVGLAAPKPIVVVHGNQDPIFPIAATREQFRRLQKIYDSAGAPDHCTLIIGDGGHRFFAQPGWDAMKKYM